MKKAKTIPSEIVEEIRPCSGKYTFQLDVEGVGKEFVASTSFPNFNCAGDDRHIAISSNYVSPDKSLTDIHAQYYFSAAPGIIEWVNEQNRLDQRVATRKGTLTIFKNGDTPYVVFNLEQCKLFQVDFGTSDYEISDGLRINVSFRALATPAVAK